MVTHTQTQARINQTGEIKFIVADSFGGGVQPREKKTKKNITEMAATNHNNNNKMCVLEQRCAPVAAPEMYANFNLIMKYTLVVHHCAQPIARAHTHTQSIGHIHSWIFSL